MKKLTLTWGLLALLTSAVLADDVKVEPQVSAKPESTADAKDGKGGGDFSGTITAVENDRDSITVTDEEGHVKMFSVSPEEKAKLSVGQRVTASFTDQYSWPLPTKRISIAK